LSSNARPPSKRTGQGLGRCPCAKRPRAGKLDAIDEKIIRVIAMVQARFEHPFRVIKTPVGSL